MRKTLAILATAVAVATPPAQANSGVEQALLALGIFGAGYAVAQNRSPYPQGVPPVYVGQQGYPQVVPQQPVVVYNAPIYVPPQRCFQPFYDRFGQYLGSRAVSCY